MRRHDRVPPGPPIEELSLCTFDGARVEGAEIVGRALLSSFIGAQLIEPLATPGARLELCRLDGALLQSPALGGMELICCSLRDLEVRGGQLGRLLVICAAPIFVGSACAGPSCATAAWRGPWSKAPISLG